MKFSIIIPVHNSQDTIESCVESIVIQKEVDLQIIIVENGSTDNSLHICKRLQEKYDNLQVYVSDIPSVSVARNLGLRYATGDIITFCDADDYLLPNSLCKVSKIFGKYAVQIVCTGFQIKIDKQILQRASKREEIISASKMIEYVSCNPDTMGTVWNKFFKKEIIDNIEFKTDLTHAEDAFFCVELLSKNKDEKVCILPIVTYCYVSNSESVTHDYSRLFDERSNLKYLNSFNKMLLELPLSTKEKVYIKDEIFTFAVEMMLNKKVKKTELQSRILYEEIRRTCVTFILRVFRFNWKHRIKLSVMGMWIIFSRQSKKGYNK